MTSAMGTVTASTIFRFDCTHTVAVPIRRVGDRWECFYGGDVPVEEGTLGDHSHGPNYG